MVTHTHNSAINIANSSEMDAPTTQSKRYQAVAEICQCNNKKISKEEGGREYKDTTHQSILNQIAMLGFLETQIHTTCRRLSPGPNQSVKETAVLNSFKALKTQHAQQKVKYSRESMQAAAKSRNAKKSSLSPPSSKQIVSNKVLETALSAEDIIALLELRNQRNEEPINKEKELNQKRSSLGHKENSYEGRKANNGYQSNFENRLQQSLGREGSGSTAHQVHSNLAHTFRNLSQDYRRYSNSDPQWGEIESRGKNTVSTRAYRAPIQERMGRSNHPAENNQQVRQNPFMTASSFYQMENIQNGSGGFRNQHQRGNTSDEWQDEDGYDLHGQGRPAPSMGGGLRKKRKFKPPAKIGEQGASSGKNRPPGLSAALDKNLKNEEDGDEKELPEALKGCDPQLVEKIENEIIHSGDPITFDDVAGLEFAKKNIEEMVIWPMKRPDLFVGLRTLPKGLLLFGPPGTGKTMIGKAIAHQSGATFFSISASSLTSKWIGEGEKLVRTLFAVARYRQPAIVFIDEVDSLLTMRTSDENEASRRIKTEFLVQLDGAGTNSSDRVLVVGATNRPQELDEAARRRFVKRLYIPLPDQAGRLQLLQRLLGKNPHSLRDEEVEEVVRRTEGFSGADLHNLCTEAALAPLRELGSRILEIATDKVPAITMDHFISALECMGCSVSPSEIEFYLDWNKTFGTYERSRMNKTS